MIVDGKNLIAGRLASKVAKAAVKGEKVIVINAEEVVIVGNKESTLEKFYTRTHASVLSNPHYGPKYDRIPSKILRRMVKGMLPNGPRARERIIKLVTIYNATPKLMPKEDVITFKEIEFDGHKNHITLKELGTLLGAKW
ncbi:MAG TPA: 50S ribosomal protein L13 [archaeon]|nr:50S ribosomal protein L13 [archaeon]